MTLTVLQYPLGFLKSCFYYTSSIKFIRKFGNCRDIATDNYSLDKQLKSYEEPPSKYRHTSEILWLLDHHNKASITIK